MLKKVQKLRFTGKFLVKRAYTELNMYSRFTVFFRDNTVNLFEKMTKKMFTIIYITV